MNDAVDDRERPAPKRGEAAWKAVKEGVAERNQQARKAGRQEREAYERQQHDRRRKAELRRMH